MFHVFALGSASYLRTFFCAVPMLHWFTCKKKTLIFKSEKVCLESLEKKNINTYSYRSFKSQSKEGFSTKKELLFTLVANRKEQSVSCRDSSFGEIFTNIKL